MKFLIDHQLPRSLALHLRQLGADAIHVLDLSLEESPDRTIWFYAQGEGFVVISKDEDFVHLAARVSSGPQLVWVRIGNCRKPELYAAFDRVWPSLFAELQRGARVVELR